MKKLLIVAMVASGIGTGAPSALALSLTVTNLVGSVERGEYVRTTMSHLFLRNDRGEEFSIPYSSLKKTERDRVKLAVGAWTPPPEYRDLVNFYQAELRRIDLLEKEGKLTAEEATKRRENERKSFEGVRNRLIKEGRLPEGAVERLKDEK